MTTIHKREVIMGNLPSSPFGKTGDGGFISFTKGAIDALLVRSSGIFSSAGRKQLDDQEISEINDRMASDGLRVIGIAMREFESLPEHITLKRLRRI